MHNDYPDMFSSAASGYRKYRPHYPAELYDVILNYTAHRRLAWDAATGNGQVASVLSEHFDRVIASDISKAQLRHAIQRPNIAYKAFPVEAAQITSGTVDCTTAAQAAHWFDFDAFCSEVYRVSDDGAILAIWSYGLFESHPEIDREIRELYFETLDPCWHPSRQHIDNAYADLNAPFELLEQAELEMVHSRSLDNIAGYLNTGSALNRFREQFGTNPVDAILKRLKESLGSDYVALCRTPVTLKVWRVKEVI